MENVGQKEKQFQLSHGLSCACATASGKGVEVSLIGDPFTIRTNMTVRVEFLRVIPALRVQMNRGNVRQNHGSFGYLVSAEAGIGGSVVRQSVLKDIGQAKCLHDGGMDKRKVGSVIQAWKPVTSHDFVDLFLQGRLVLRMTDKVSNGPSHGDACRVITSTKHGLHCVYNVVIR